MLFHSNYMLNGYIINILSLHINYCLGWLAPCTERWSLTNTKILCPFSVTLSAKDSSMQLDKSDQCWHKHFDTLVENLSLGIFKLSINTRGCSLTSLSLPIIPLMCHAGGLAVCTCWNKLPAIVCCLDFNYLSLTSYPKPRLICP
jgi:hypothetical protein